MLKTIIDRWGFRRALRAAAAAPNPSDQSKDKDVVLLPCWRRPEFLWHCIDNLSHADGIENIHVIFRPDTGFAPDILDVIPIGSAAAVLEAPRIPLALHRQPQPRRWN